MRRHASNLYICSPTTGCAVDSTWIAWGAADWLLFAAEIIGAVTVVAALVFGTKRIEQCETDGCVDWLTNKGGGYAAVDESVEVDAGDLQTDPSRATVSFTPKNLLGEGGPSHHAHGI